MMDPEGNPELDRTAQALLPAPNVGSFGAESGFLYCSRTAPL